jgi:hypothetical protein
MKRFAGMVLLALFLAFPAAVLAMGFESFGNEPVLKQANWVQGVVNVVNLPSRVYSYWVNGDESFFYRGDAEALNEALRQFARIESDGHQLILLPGAGTAHSFNGKPIPFDWHFNPQSIYWSTDKKRPPKLTVYVSALKPRALDRRSVEKSLDELESDSFQARDKARRDLEKLGNDAKPFLQAALKAQPTLEKRRRLESLLAKLPAFDVADLEIPKGIVPITVDDLLAVHLKGINQNDPDANILKDFQTAIDHLETAKDRPEFQEELRKKLSILEDIREFKKRIAR